MYIYFNPNPSGKNVGDCVIRGISFLTGDDWESTYVGIAVKGFEMLDMPSSNAVWAEYLRQKGYRRYVIPDTCPNCYTVKEFCKDNPDGLFLLTTVSHVVAVKDGDYYDAWDSGNEVPIKKPRIHHSGVYFFCNKKTRRQSELPTLIV